MAAASMNRAGNVSDMAARAMQTLPSSSGCQCYYFIRSNCSGGELVNPSKSSPEMTFAVRDERRPRHHWADNEVLDVHGREIGLAGYGIYMYLGRHADNKTGRCTKRQADIAAAFGCSTDTVQRHTAKLVEAGLIAIKEGAIGKTFTYVLLQVHKVQAANCGVVEPQNAAQKNADCGTTDRKMRPSEPQIAVATKEARLSQDFSQDGEAAPQPDADAEALPSLSLARKVIEDCCLADNPSMVRAVASAIDYCLKREGRSKGEAVRFLINRCSEALDTGEAVNRFWFDDRAWRPKTVSHTQPAVSEDATQMIEERRRKRVASAGAHGQA
jgi:DNA-binding MarR family transcriptional regulator